MTPEEVQRLQAAAQEIAAILYKNTPPEAVATLEGIEKTVRQQMLQHVSPEIALFLPLQTTGIETGRSRQIKSCVGMLPITDRQAERLGLEARGHLSPVLEKCCLRISANESYQNAEADLEAMTGIKVGHTTLHRLVQRQEFLLPRAKQPITEVCIDGGKVRLRGEEEGQQS